MMHGQSASWLKALALALAPLLALVVALPSQALLRCHMDGQLRAACCCPSDDAARDPAGPAVSAQDCCDRVLLESDHQPSQQVRASQQDVERTVELALAVPVVGWSPETRIGVPAFAGSGPPGIAVGLVLLKHAFLI